MENSETLVYDQQAMVGFYMMLSGIIQELGDAYEKAENAKAVFADCYIGDAEVEIDLFLGSLPAHIFRLQVFYSKLMEFICVTAESVLQNDMKMAEKIGGR